MASPHPGDLRRVPPFPSPSGSTAASVENPRSSQAPVYSGRHTQESQVLCPPWPPEQGPWHPESEQRRINTCVLKPGPSPHRHTYAHAPAPPHLCPAALCPRGEAPTWEPRSQGFQPLFTLSTLFTGNQLQLPCVWVGD